MIARAISPPGAQRCRRGEVSRIERSSSRVALDNIDE
jgi:hypothetical protein